MSFKKPRKITYSFLLIIAFVMSGFFVSPQKAAAAWPAVTAISDALKAISTVYDSKSSVANKSLSTKELFLDGIAFTVVNNIIEHIADSTVDWINNGFEDGGPGFITNFDGFLGDVGDQTLGDFISGSPLAFLCSPFSLDIKIALSLQLGGEREARCTLSDAFDNINNAIDDLGNNWSWDKWANISQSQNNAYGAYSEAYADVTLRMAEAKDKAIVKSNWGGGMLEFQSCEPDKTDQPFCDPTGGNDGPCPEITIKGECTTKTPGSLIQDTLGDTLMMGNKRLIISDEINEIVGALLNQLFNSVIGSDGLLGSTPGATYGYTQLPASTVTEMTGYIDEAVTIENNYIAWKEQSLAMVNYAGDYLQALIDCWDSYPIVIVGITPPNLTQAEIDTKIATAQAIIDGTIIPLQTRLEAEILVAQTNLETLESLLSDLEVATDENGEADADAVSEIWSEFNKLTGLHTEVDVVEAEQEFQGPTTTGDDPIQTQMDAIIAQVVTDSAECTDGGGTFDQPVYIPPPDNPGNPNNPNPPVDPALEWEAKSYPSLSAYPYNDSVRGTLTGFKDRYDYEYLDIVPGQNVWIGGGIGDGNNPYPRDYQGGFRVYLPPDLEIAQLNLYVPQEGDVAVVARFGQPPSDDYKSVAFEDIPSRGTGFDLNKIKNQNGYSKRGGGIIPIFNNYIIPLKKGEGGWLYVKFLDFDGGYGVFAIGNDNHLKADPNLYKEWYYSTKWDEAGEPLPLIGFSGSNPSAPAPTCQLGAEPSTINKGQSTAIGWYSTNATSGSINNGVGSVGQTVQLGAVTITPTQTTTYTGTFYGSGGTATCSTKVTVK